MKHKTFLNIYLEFIYSVINSDHKKLDKKQQLIKKIKFCYFLTQEILEWRTKATQHANK